MITAGIRTFLDRFLPAEAARHGVRILALGMVDDHVHLILHLPLVSDIPRLVQGLKGASARLINRDVQLSTVGLRWDRGYDIRSISPKALTRAIGYVRSQHHRHADRVISAPGDEATGVGDRAPDS